MGLEKMGTLRPEMLGKGGADALDLGGIQIELGMGDPKEPFREGIPVFKGAGHLKEDFPLRAK